MLWTQCLLALCIFALPVSVVGQCQQLPEECYQPNGTDCAWFEQCLNARIPCGITYPNYQVDGLGLCDLYAASTLALSPFGVETIQAARKCVQTTLLHMLDERYINSDNDTWSKNVDERPHRPLVTPPDSEWIRPTLTHLIYALLGPLESTPKTASRSIQPFLLILPQSFPMLFNGADNPQIARFLWGIRASI